MQPGAPHSSSRTYLETLQRGVERTEELCEQRLQLLARLRGVRLPERGAGVWQPTHLKRCQPHGAVQVLHQLLRQRAVRARRQQNELPAEAIVRLVVRTLWESEREVSFRELQTAPKRCSTSRSRI
jgi:hypothetical protein